MFRSRKPTPDQLTGAVCTCSKDQKHCGKKILLAFPFSLSWAKLGPWELYLNNISLIPWPESTAPFPGHCNSVFLSHPLWNGQIEGSSFSWPDSRHWGQTELIRDSFSGDRIDLLPTAKALLKPSWNQNVPVPFRGGFLQHLHLGVPRHPSNKALFMGGGVLLLLLVPEKAKFTINH